MKIPQCDTRRRKLPTSSENYCDLRLYFKTPTIEKIMLYSYRNILCSTPNYSDEILDENPPTRPEGVVTYVERELL